ncbi:MAG: serine hydrolase domain-containing protein [Nitrospira sp.]|nr:beta-lactamase family protein [Nitrospira sp.]MBP6604578.1 beta-lactamase family protein [Nitrospira sp.]HQY58393.1 serine hydrolase domain-containing protein [Nitrospira sp.]HRA97434.1 serine hydrolase domain-containing protein [Nitrospira sp.]
MKTSISNSNQLVEPSDAGLNADALTCLDAVIQSYIDNGDNYGASIIIARGGKIGHQKTFGTVAPERATAHDDIFMTMSLAKSYTAALVLRAIDQGRFTLDTKIDSLIPGFAQGGKQEVTVQMLLTHTAGVYNLIALPPPHPLAENGILRKTVEIAKITPATYKPGTACAYTPMAGINTLGWLLVVTDPKGRQFRDIAHEDLFEPLGMVNSSFGIDPKNPRRVPMSYTPKRTVPTTPQVVAMLEAISLGDAEMPSGGGHSSSTDVFRFADTMRQRGSSNGYRLISPALFEYAAKNHTGDMVNGAWVSACLAEGRPPYRANFSLLGGYCRDKGDYLTPMGYTASPRAIGAMGGGSTMWMVDPERDLTIAFLSAGFIDGLQHTDRCSRINDLALAACE